MVPGPPASPVRIGFCITDLDPGGAERALVQIVRRLDRSRWEPFVICLSPPGALVEDLRAADIPVTCLGVRSRWDFAVLGKLTRELNARQPRLLQTFLYHANITGRIAGRRARVSKIVSGIRVAEKRSRMRLWIDRATSGLVDHHVCVSQSVADFSIKNSRLPPDRVTVIPNGVDVERFSSAAPADLSEFGIPPSARTIISVGRLDPQKAPQVLLEAAQPITAVHSDVHVLFVGDGPLRSVLETEIAGRCLQDRVHFAGWRGDVPELLKASACLALTSAWEGMPNVVLEAMASGLPVVATDVEGCAEVVKSGETGLLVPSGSVPAVTEALRRVLEQPDEARRMALAAQAVVRDRFTWDRVAAEYDRLYASLLEY